ncbi:unnamed protein product [Vitrella brassicaformis CCMP3155]|uniref:Uncharacterized protein n=1 Tax=Vitrella brassicaformis (strain CCMP3155) TaxID=1169540 RepID=A0A0G4G6E6_VITBC|nr:unnamed protein product [Vitrella brassicaformis CCMP3155]|eukprot:CEM24102.1 unnamed protein product [Vitrella brassicaformis CCMP3155]
MAGQSPQSAGQPDRGRGQPAGINVHSPPIPPFGLGRGFPVRLTPKSQFADNFASPMESSFASAAASIKEPLVCILVTLPRTDVFCILDRANEAMTDLLFGCNWPSPPSGFIIEHEGGNNGSILSIIDAPSRIWKTVELEEQTAVSAQEEQRWMALCREERVIRAVQAKCEDLGMRPFLPVLAAFTDVDSPNGLFRSTWTDNVPMSQEEAADMHRVFAIQMPRLNIGKYADFKDILQRCSAVSNAVSSSRVAQPQVQGMLKEVALS